MTEVVNETETATVIETGPEAETETETAIETETETVIETETETETATEIETVEGLRQPTVGQALPNQFLQMHPRRQFRGQGRPGSRSRCAKGLPPVLVQAVQVVVDLEHLPAATTTGHPVVMVVG